MPALRTALPLARSVRGFASKPPAPVVGKANLSAPQKSSPMEGLYNGGVLVGTMVVCLIPGIWAAITPAPDAGH